MKEFTFLSLGAGWQSSTIALMAKHGELPMPDAAIFADTGAEPRAVYEWLDKLEGLLPFPIYRVGNGDIIENTLAGRNTSGGRFVSLPLFLKDGGIGRRQCTSEYKIKPVLRKVRELAGLEPGERAKGKVHIRQWIGITTDEITRMKEAPEKWITNEFPLIDKRMSAWDCHMWLERRQYHNVPRSACTVCPFRKRSEWRRMSINQPEEFSGAVAFDHGIRENGPLRGMKQEQYLSSDRVPLDQVDLSNAEDNGQYSFLDECDGVCGV